MSKGALSCLSLAFAAGAALAASSTTPTRGIRESDSDLIAFTGATIVVSPTQTIESGTLLIEDGRVLAVGAALEAPAGSRTYDLDGKTILPGLIDPYTEYGLSHIDSLEAQRSDHSANKEGDRGGANAWNHAIHAEREWVDEFRPDEETAAALMERGVTTVQSVKMDGVFRGRGFVASLAQGLSNDVVLVPLGPHFASFDSGSSSQGYPSSLMGSIALVRQTLLDADWYTRAHAAYAHNPSQDSPEVNRALAALAEIDGPIVFETDDELSLLRAGRISREFSIPFIHVGSNMEYNRLEEVAALDQPIILPLVFPAVPDVRSYENELDVDLFDLRHWERAPSNPATLADRGVRIALTGRGLEDGDFFAKLRLAIERGLDPSVALAALTTVPAEMLGLAAEAGTLESGKRADFLIADGDPLTAEADIVSVWIGGELAKEIEPLEGTDFRGHYQLTVGDTAYTLSLEGETAELEGKLTLGEDSVELQDLDSEHNRLRFTADLGALQGDGVGRFTLLALDDRMTAQATLADGRLLALDLSPGQPPVPAEEDDGEEGGEAAGETGELLSRLTFPNMAFGYETLPAAEDVLVRNATLWTNEADSVLEGADLLVVQGRIAAVGQGLSAPAGARVIDATGKHVTPGLIDEHSHIAISGNVNEGSHAVTAEVRVGDVVNSDHIGIYRALAGGTTAAQLLHGSANPIGGQAQIIKLRWGRSPEDLKLAGAPPSIKFALGENVKQSNWGDEYTERYPQTRMGVESIIRDRFQAAREYERARAEYEALDSDRRARMVPPRRDLQLEALHEILDSERFVHCHSYVQSEILMLMRLAEELGFRIQTFTHILEGYKVAPEMAAHGAGASSFADWWAYKFEVYDAIPQNACLMHEAGVVTSVNSDSQDLVRRLNQEAAKSVLHCGMAEEDALRLVTLNPAIQLRIDDRVGSLRAGKDADFVIWSGHPLSMYSRVEETWVDGTRHFSLERDLATRKANRIERQLLVQKALEENGDSDSGGSGREPGRHRKPSENWDCEDVGNVWHAQDSS